MKNRPAYTIIEILVSILMISALMVPTVLALRNIRQKQALSASTETLVAVLKRAHIFARESKGNEAWGVRYKDNTSYLMVSGDPANWVSDSEFPLEEPVEFRSGGFVVWFDEGSGGTAGLTTITIGTPSGDTSEITVSKTGIVEVR